MHQSNQHNPEVEGVAAEIIRHRVVAIESALAPLIALQAALEAEDARKRDTVDAAASLGVATEHQLTPDSPVGDLSARVKELSQ